MLDNAEQLVVLQLKSSKMSTIFNDLGIVMSYMLYLDCIYYS